MLRVLSKEEELEGRREAFAKLRPGSLFDLAQERFFIAVKKIDEAMIWIASTSGSRERGHIELARVNTKESRNGLVPSI